MRNLTTTRRFMRSGFRRLLSVLVLLMLSAGAAGAAQATSATLTGSVVDTTGAVLRGVDLSLINVATSGQRRAASGQDGGFIFAHLVPGQYVLRASFAGFSVTELSDIVLSVDDRLSVRVELALESRGEQLTVVAETPRISTSPSVSTVVDRQFVENLPLNGRSFQALLELTPGVVFAPGVGSATGGNSGQFSVNGQRANTNYFTVDGVSANVGMASGVNPQPGGAGSGQLPGLTAIGSTASLVSVDALQEFRIQASSYAPEFGRTPGGQVSLVTRSGTNTFHGSVFDYVRHDAMDATDFFVNNRGLEKPRMRQHDFGGVLGGPLVRRRVFFFGSYEGLRLQQPRAAISNVPSLATRQNAVPAAQPYLNAYPVPNGRELGNGFAEFAASWSNKSRVDSTSVRVDHHVRSGLSLFGRVSHSPSYSQTRSLSTLSSAHANNTSATAGMMWLPSPRVAHDLRINYSTNDAPFSMQPDDYGGAVPLPPTIFGTDRSPENAYFLVNVGGVALLWGLGSDFKQRSLNIIDSLTVLTSTHEWKFGVDYRRIHPLLRGSMAGFEVLSMNPTSVAAGRASSYSISVKPTDSMAVAYDNFSAYAQDNWRLTPRLTLTYGIRWELVPPPHVTEGEDALTLENLDDPYGGHVGLAPRGTPLWKTRYGNVVPRVGVSYMVSTREGAQLVVKGGVGKFHDLGFGQIANAFVLYPFTATREVTSPVLPVPADARVPPRLANDPPFSMAVMDRDVELPVTWQWNVSAQQSLGNHQTLTIGYVGAEGRKLLKLDRYSINLVEWPTAPRTAILVNRNRGHSDYHALQVQFQRRLHRGLQSMASYTFGRSRDTASSDSGSFGGSLSIPAERVAPELDYGYSDFDIRHALTAAVTWQLPAASRPSWLRPVARDWAIDVMFRTRSGSPVLITTSVAFPPVTETVRPNVVSGQPFWIEDSTVPAGRYLNRQAFSVPAAATQGNLPRGSIHGFSVRQVDLALRRDFSLTGAARVQLRLEVFNLLNTPNFANPVGVLDAGTFGQAFAMLNLALGGLNSLYQPGGARSTQIAAKLLF